MRLPLYQFPPFVLAFALGLTLGWVPRAAAELSGSVNGVKISENLITLELSYEPRLRQHVNISEERMKAFKAQALERLIERELLFPEARRRKLAPSAKTVEQNVQRGAKKLGGKATLKKLLKDGGLTLAEYSDWVRKNLAATALHNSIYTLAATGAAEQYYAAHTSDYVQPVRVKTHMILIPLAPLATTTEVSDAEKVASKVQAAWSAEPATDPVQLAARFQARFVDMGILHEGSVVEGISETVFALAPGQVSQPLRTIYGWHLVRILERFPQKQLPFDEVALAIRTNLGKKQGDEAYLQLLESLRAKAVILRKN